MSVSCYPDLFGRGVLEVRLRRIVVRVFRRYWRHCEPFAFRRWGIIGFGAGPLAVNILRAVPLEPPSPTAS